MHTAFQFTRHGGRDGTGYYPKGPARVKRNRLKPLKRLKRLKRF